MPTISDVAKLAGLSRATVSRVINNHPYVTEEKKRLVEEAMDHLGYIPNSHAQFLRKQKTNIIAVLVPKLTNPYFAYLVESLERQASRKGFQILICNTLYDKKREIEFLELLKKKQVDGIIMTTIENAWEKINAIPLDGPILFCNEYVTGVNVPSIRLNNVEGGYIGTRHLIQRGHTKIGYCWGGDDRSLSKDRWEGYQSAMTEQRLPIKKSWLFEKTFDIEDGRRVMNEIMTMEDKPTALFTGSDEVAAGIISEAKKLGLSVPEDMAVIGFDDQPIARVVEPQLTTIRQPIEEIGDMTIKVMLELLTNKEKMKKRLIYELPLKLVVRDSS
ncbi:LacI family DNA-binding transcriptional regulator [Lederbergia lenta]|uniref:LacI family transcriptional regulator n=1 Tax=Lederbergia lenta TaxID=1467 RepID=A0A2X4VMP4_LEDLE|nr:LacI family DNA-binding transcriptional regulator [Lederbergia lenta]MCM3113242.1 LacI family transcriptional regulator [Lederbergia lenta]MEC2325969.1 LacI family DNA-binding transcriptional regulator [Lederbergia lenta]SQI53426.1 LacI family transcriptional regulator [Lederbergia lenta]